jgi:RNA polymerase sigma-70 factor (ECF subfamily)
VSNDRQRQDLQTTFIEHRDRLQEAAKRIVGTRDLAEDILQSAYLRITETSVQFIIRQPLNYCFQVVRHLAIDCCRRRSLEAQFFVAEVEGHAVPAPQFSPEMSAMSGQFLVRIGEALARLPPRTRQAFMLYRLQGMTQRDIAGQLGVSPTLVNFMIKDAIEALKGCRDDTGP